MENQNLETLIPQYAANKAELDGYKKICDKENSLIKNLMYSAGLTEMKAGGYVAKRTVQKRESVNEDMLLQIAHLHGIPEIIKTKEYIDFDALEDAIYGGKISQDVLLEIAKARQTTEVVVLKVSKVKEGK